MKQTFALATLVTLTLASPIAYALGFGQPAVHSYLHAPLNVSIPLVDADQYAPDQLRVRVAGRPAFQAVGLEWNALVAGVRAEVHAGSDTPEVRLTSTAPATTPWLDLLLTLSSPEGDITRNVTLLFSPSAKEHQGDAGADAVDPSGARALVAGINSTASSTRVHNGDTLWSVAERLKPASASIEQVMLALVAANPGAFPSGNINGLNAGFELKVPATAKMLSRPRAQAAQTIDYMNTAWRIRGPNGPVHVPLGPSGAAGSSSAEPDTTADEPAATPLALSDAALGVARTLGQATGASELEQDQARLERVIGQRDRLREEMSQLKAEVSQLTDELALQEVELARQEMRGVTALPVLPAEEGSATPEEPAENTAVAPPTSELAIAGRGMMAIASEYRWPLGGVVLVLLVLLVVWRCWRRPSPVLNGTPDDADEAMLGRSQAAGLASSRRDEQRGTEEVAFGPSSQDNTRSTS